MIASKKRAPGPPPGWRPGGTETAAGMMAEHWTEEDDRILEAIDRDRHRPSTRELPQRASFSIPTFSAHSRFAGGRLVDSVRPRARSNRRWPESGLFSQVAQSNVVGPDCHISIEVVVTHDRRFIQSDDHVVEIEDGLILA
jgi:hypothetical protein